jgi:hypothetical protein
MRTELTAEQAQFARQVLAAGRVKSSEEAAEFVLSRWPEYQRRRGELISMIQEADNSLERGEGTTLNSAEELHEFFEGVRQRGKERFLSRVKAS